MTKNYNVYSILVNKVEVQVEHRQNIIRAQLKYTRVRSSIVETNNRVGQNLKSNTNLEHNRAKCPYIIKLVKTELLFIYKTAKRRPAHGSKNYMGKHKPSNAVERFNFFEKLLGRTEHSRNKSNFGRVDQNILSLGREN